MDNYLPGRVYIFKLVATNQLILGTTKNIELEKKKFLEQHGQIQTISNCWTFNMAYVANWMRLSYAEYNIFEEYLEIDSREWFEVEFKTALEMRVALFLKANLVNLGYVAVASFILFTVFLLIWKV